MAARHARARRIAATAGTGLQQAELTGLIDGFAP
jgi:hypothetical protein